MKTNSVWLCLILGAVMVLRGILTSVYSDEGFVWRGVFVESWTGWPLLLLGIVVCGLSIRALLRGEGKPRPYTDADAEKAKKELDAQFLRDHGRPPEAPEEEKPAGQKPGSA